MSAVVIVGIGNPFRGDDGLGHIAAELVGRESGMEVRLTDGEPTRLVDAWADSRIAIVLDAIRGGAPPGTIHRFEVGHTQLPSAFKHPSTHGAGLESAVALGQALDLNPEILIIYGVEPEDMSEGRGLSAPVEESLPILVESVLEEVRTACA